MEAISQNRLDFAARLARIEGNVASARPLLFAVMTSGNRVNQIVSQTRFPSLMWPGITFLL
jgi:hypothetical protein